MLDYSTVIDEDIEDCLFEDEEDEEFPDGTIFTVQRIIATSGHFNANNHWVYNVDKELYSGTDYDTASITFHNASATLEKPVHFIVGTRLLMSKSCL